VTAYRVDFDTIPWESPVEGMRHKVFIQGSRKLRLVEYSKKMEPHWCEKGHYGFVLEGEFEIAFDSETHLYGPGDGIFIPDGKEHRHMGKVLSTVVTVLFVEDVPPQEVAES
jgi:quercetin dioxygenase-like cupin family protein